MNILVIEGHAIAVSNSDKIWFPESEITKGKIISYYAFVAPFMLDHVKNHLLTLQRFPEGILAESFYQKNASSYFPQWVFTHDVPNQEGAHVNYVVARNQATIVYLANQGTLTFHTWQSTYKKLDYPDRMIFDLDPSTSNFTQVRHAALLLKEILEELNLVPCVMTTGSHGLHVVVHLKPVHTYQEIADFSLKVAQKMQNHTPKDYTLEIRKDKRGSKIFIDTLRNRIGATAVVPYSVRPHPKAPVAMPIAWTEVHSSRLSSQKYTIVTAPAYLKRNHDAWRDQMQAYSLKKLFKKVGME